MQTTLTPELAAGFAILPLEHVTREYPNKMDHVLSGPGDVRGPRAAHPLFYGSFDWHSCVHGYWVLARLLRAYPGFPLADRIRSLMTEQITPVNVAGELAYLDQPLRGTFERPYGWAWLLMLQSELARHSSDEGRAWRRTLEPLARSFVERFSAFLPKATYPIRVGTHFNTAFALALALEYAEVTNDSGFAAMLRAKAVAWYGHDTDCQAWEPGGDDFLSSALMEGECMRRALPSERFDSWFRAFLPRIERREPATLFTPVGVTDRSDGKIRHLDGYNLSRAWCWRALASGWRDGDARKAIALEAAERQLVASLPHVAGDYSGEHWLATFALLAMANDGRQETTGAMPNPPDEPRRPS